MIKLKVGDKLRVINEKKVGWDNSVLNVGDIVEVTSVASYDFICTDKSGERWGFMYDDFHTYFTMLNPKPQKVKIVNGKLEIDLSKVGRTKRQQYTVASLIEQKDLLTLISYMDSMHGRSTKRLRVPKIKDTSHDKLEFKGSNSILRMFDDMTNPRNSHTPLTKRSGWFGVEIECFIPFESVGVESGDDDCPDCEGSGNYCDEDGDDHDCLTCDGSGRRDGDSESRAHAELRRLFQKNRIKYASIKSDSSIDAEDSDDQFTVEVTVLTRLDDLKNLKQVCDLLSKLGAKVNRSCGMHTHIDCRHLDEEQVLNMGKMFERSLPVLLGMVPKSRRTNTYCKPKMSSSMRDGDERYCAINLTSYSKYKTLEIRLHSGTTDFKKITNWLTLLDAISRANVPKKCSDINDLTDYISIPESVLEYITQRTALFSEAKDCTNLEVCESDSTESEQHDLNRLVATQVASIIDAISDQELLHVDWSA